MELSGTIKLARATPGIWRLHAPALRLHHRARQAAGRHARPAATTEGACRRCRSCWHSRRAASRGPQRENRAAGSRVCQVVLLGGLHPRVGLSGRGELPALSKFRQVRKRPLRNTTVRLYDCVHISHGHSRAPPAMPRSKLPRARCAKKRARSMARSWARCAPALGCRRAHAPASAG